MLNLKNFSLFEFGILLCLTDVKAHADNSLTDWPIDPNRPATIYVQKRTKSGLNRNAQYVFGGDQNSLVADPNLLKQHGEENLKTYIKNQLSGEQSHILEDVKVVIFDKRTTLPYGDFERGERDVTARRDLPAYTMLGIYDGVVDRPGLDKATALHHWVQTDKKSLKSIEPYTIKLKYKNVAPWGIYPVGALNIPHLINAVCSHGSRVHKKLDRFNTPDCYNRWNVSGSFVWCKGHITPVLLYYTHREVKEGEALLTDYGSGYWDSVQENNDAPDLTDQIPRENALVYKFTPTAQTQETKTIAEWEANLRRR